MLINRERELEALESRYVSERAELVVVTGRRRVGKTALLAAFAQSKRALRFTAYLDSEDSQLRRLSVLLRQLEQPGSSPPDDFTYGSWEALFQTMGELSTEERLLVVLDEWPYLAGSGVRLASVLQHIWDETLQHTRLMLVLSGSYLSIMDRDFLGQKAPLYGRRTSQLLLSPLRLRDATAFLPGYEAETMVEAYAVVGGISDRVDLLTNLRNEVFRRDSFLFNEPDLVLREELREPRLYAALLRSIAAGHHRVSDLARGAGFADRATATRYLATLRSLGLVEHRRPVGPRASGQSWGSWFLADPYLRFWGRWILPYTSQIEFGETELLIQEALRPGWDQFVGFAWEELARQHVHEMAARREIPFWPEDVGSWWSGQAQIDVVAVQGSRRSALIGEALWRREKMNVADLERLRKSADHWLGDERGWELWYALFSRSGFTEELRARSADDGHVLLVGPADMVSAS